MAGCCAHALSSSVPRRAHRCLSFPTADDAIEDAYSQPDAPGKVVQITVRRQSCSCTRLLPAGVQALGKALVRWLACLSCRHAAAGVRVALPLAAHLQSGWQQQAGAAAACAAALPAPSLLRFKCSTHGDMDVDSSACKLPLHALACCLFAQMAVVPFAGGRRCQEGDCEAGQRLGGAGERGQSAG